MQRCIQLAILTFIMLIAIVACGGSAAGDPAKTVESYIQAKVASDRDKIRSLLCASMESQLDREALSFKGVQASIKDMSCKRDSDVVRCGGKIVAVYNGENQDIPLGAYHVVQEDGAWKWCGVAQ